MEIAGTVALITGSGSGIGRASALALAAAGSSIVVADIDPERASAVAQQVVDGGGNALAITCDVTANGAFETLRDHAIERFGRVDIVMNNVGVIAVGQPELIPIEEWQRVIDINLLSVIRSNAVFIPHLLGQGSGHIVITASTAGLFRTQWNMAPYEATKAALVGLADALWMYLVPRGVGVTCLVPGPVLSNIVEQMRFFGDPGPFPGPDFPLIAPEVVGDQVVAAIASGRYVQYTHEGILEVAIAATTDREAFLRTQLDRPGFEFK